MDNQDYEIVEVPEKSMASYNPYSIPIMSSQEKANLLEQIKPDAIVEIIRHKLMGEERIEGKWKKNPALKDRAVNEVCAWDVANLMLPASSLNVSLTKLSNHEIRRRTLNIVKAVQYLLLRNWEAYEIKGADQFNYVHQIVMTNTFITLKQPDNEGFRNWLGKTSNEQRVYSSQEKEKRGGILSNFFRK